MFVAAFVADVTWAKWAHHVAELRPVRAALWGVGIVVLGAVSIDAIASDRWYTIPAALGAGLGTFVAVAHARRGKTLDR